MLPLYATGKVIIWLAKVALKNLIFGFKLLMVPFLLTIILFKKLWSLLTPVGAIITSFGEKLLWLVKLPLNLLKDALGWIVEKASPILGFFRGVGDAVKSILDPIMGVVKWIWNLADVLFEKAFASTFLEGLGKVADAFGLMKDPLTLLMEPFRLIKDVIDSVGESIGTLLAAAESIGANLGASMNEGLGTVSATIENIIKGAEMLGTTLPNAIGSAVVESMDGLLASMEARLPKIVSTINDVDIMKAGAVAATMVAGAAAGAATSIVGGGGGAAAPAAGAVAGAGAQTVRQPIHLVIDGEPLKKYILEIIGTDIREVNFG
jgi:phage-related protein